jgi:hypothetical protein
MSDNIVALVGNQEGSGRINIAQLELVENLRKDIESLKTTIPKKRKTKAEPPTSTV